MAAMSNLAVIQLNNGKVVRREPDPPVSSHTCARGSQGALFWSTYVTFDAYALFLADVHAHMCVLSQMDKAENLFDKVVNFYRSKIGRCVARPPC